MQFLRAVSHSIMHAQPIQIAYQTTAPMTLLTAVKSACFNRVKVWLWCRAGIFASVAVAQTLSHPWTVVARYATHPFAWCCVCMAKCTSSGQ